MLFNGKNENGENVLSLVLTCRECGKNVNITVLEKDYDEYYSPNRTRLIQDIFPYLKLDEREMFISGTCDECFKKMFGVLQ